MKNTIEIIKKKLTEKITEKESAKEKLVLRMKDAMAWSPVTIIDDCGEEMFFRAKELNLLLFIQARSGTIEMIHAATEALLDNFEHYNGPNSTNPMTNVRKLQEFLAAKTVFFYMREILS